MNGPACRIIDDPRVQESWKGTGFPLKPHLLLLARIGSHSHGTFVPTTDPNGIDDTDYAGIIAPPPSRVLGFNVWENKVIQRDELDLVFHSLSKWMRLLAKSNPNALALLWLREEDYIYVHPLLQRVLDNRDLFSSKQIYNALAGYAHDQIEKMRKSPCQGYMGEKRKQIVEKYGFDVKHASHGIRLLRMCREFLKTGVLNVYRTEDAQELVDIKQGRWTLEQVETESARLFQEASLALEKSTLPERVDTDKAENLMLSALFESWGC